MIGNQGPDLVAVLPAVGALLLLTWLLARIARTVAGQFGGRRDVFLRVVVIGLSAGVLAAVLVTGFGATRGWPWWDLAFAATLAELLIAVSVGLAIYRGSGLTKAPAPPPGPTRDARECAELRAALTRQLAVGGLLMAYARLRLLLADHAEHRYGRAVAAELAGLVQQGAATVERTSTYPPESVAIRLAAERPEVRHPEQRYLRRALGEPGELIVLAATRSVRTVTGDTRWDPLADALREEFASRWSLTSTGGLLRLRWLMRRHLRRAPRRFEDHRELHRLGMPFAILFGRCGTDPDWPWPPEDDPAWVPPTLIGACILATTYPGQERHENTW